MKQLKTSTKISIKFTLFTVLIVSLFSIAANLIFFRSWYSTNLVKLKHPMPGMIQQKIALGRQRPAIIEKYALLSEEATTLQNNIVWRNISLIQDQYFLSYVSGRSILTTIVTHPVNLQMQLLKTTFFLILFFGVLAYLLSLVFISTSLRSLNVLVQYAQNLHLNNLDKPIHIDGPKDDEIKIVAATLNESLKKIHQQTDALKDFVAHASHELKTPLMAMSTQLDVGIKKKDISSLIQLKSYVRQMNTLIEKLLLITNLENKKVFTKTSKDIVPIVSKVAKDIGSTYIDKKLQRNIVLPDTYIVAIDESYFMMLLQNLLDNAAKYTPKNGSITIQIQNDLLNITDTGKGIDHTYIDRIWEKFWQEDVSRTDKRSFGLGLYLVKKLVDLHDRKIQVKSQKGKGTSFEIEMG